MIRTAACIAGLVCCLLPLIGCSRSASPLAEAQADGGNLARTPPTTQPALAAGPMLGHVGEDVAHFWARAEGPARLSVLIAPSPDLKGGRVTAPLPLGEETGFMGSVSVGQLQPGTRYWYAPILDGVPAASPPFPSFMTAPQPGAEPIVTRIAFVSCLGGNAAAPAAAWGDMAERVKIDLLLMLGDNHYADSTEPARQRAFYAEQRRVAAFRQISARTPTYGIWDDHDYGPNNSDGTARGKERSLRTFKEHWANPSYGQPDDPGIYFKFTRGGIDFFMLDVRYHRTPNKAPDDGTKTMLGAKQLAWLTSELKASRAAVKVLAAGSEWQSHSQADCWISFDRERQEIFDFIRENGIKGVILLSGDRHFTGAYQVRNELIEVTSGPLGSKNYPSKNLPEMFFNEGEGKLYCVLEVKTPATSAGASTAPATTPRITLEVYRAGEGLIYKRPFTWDEVNGRTEIPKLPPTTAPATPRATGLPDPVGAERRS